MNSILITGGNRGLGLELISIFHKNNYKVFTVVRSKKAAEELKNRFKNNLITIVADLSSDNSINIIKDSLYKNTNTLDILINNAGTPGDESTISKASTKEVMDLFNIHCLAIIRTLQGSLEILKKSKSPRVINISSRLASLEKTSRGDFNHLNTSYSYPIAKSAQNMLTIYLAQELNNYNITVNAIHPGKLKTTSGSPDADLSPKLAAQRIYKWVETEAMNKTCSFTEPFIANIPW